MSYSNFKAKVWAKEINRELERVCVFAADTNQSYSGQIKSVGDTVRIQGVGKPKITMFGNDEKIILDNPEDIEDTSTSLVADKVATFNYGVDDIDKAQGVGGVLAVLNTEASEECANVIDKAIADLSLDKQALKLSKDATEVTNGNALTLLDEALEKLYENDVNPSTTITATISPKYYTRFKQAYIKADTDNSEMLKNGRVAKYGNAIVRMSNNVAKDSQGNEYIQVKTQRAIALAKSEAHTEPYRVEKGFTDAVKGFVIFGVKIVRPKEMVNIKVKYTA